MAWEIAEQEIREWAARDLSVQEADDGSLHCRFSYRSAPCRDDGAAFPSEIHTTLQPEEGESWRIADMWIELDTDDPVWKATCIHKSSVEPDVRRLTKYSPAKGMLLDDFLAREWPIEDAPCYCTSIHVMHKLLLALHTVRYRLTQTGGK